jgi:hypothetical protein
VPGPHPAHFLVIPQEDLWPVLPASRTRFPVQQPVGCSTPGARAFAELRSSCTSGHLRYRPGPPRQFSGPRPAPPPAFGQWKVFQLCFTIPAVHAAVVLGAVPKTTAPFTYLQMHAQLHIRFSVKYSSARFSRSFICGGAKRNGRSTQGSCDLSGDRSLCSLVFSFWCSQRANPGSSAMTGSAASISGGPGDGTNLPETQRPPAPLHQIQRGADADPVRSCRIQRAARKAFPPAIARLSKPNVER